MSSTNGSGHVTMMSLPVQPIYLLNESTNAYALSNSASSNRNSEALNIRPILYCQPSINYRVSDQRQDIIAYEPELNMHNNTFQTHNQNHTATCFNNETQYLQHSESPTNPLQGTAARSDRQTGN